MRNFDLSAVSFFPSGEQAHQLDKRMQADLADSLQKLLAQLEGQIDVELQSRYRNLLEPLLATLDSGKRASPGAFAAYYQAVLALIDGDINAGGNIELLHQQSAPLGPLVIRDLSDTGMGSAEIAALYRKAIDTDEKLSFGFHPPAAEDSQRQSASITRAIKLMQQTAGEFGVLVGEIVLAAPHTEKGSMRFDGVSSYQLWGALTLSVTEVKSDLEMMETLAHESSHSFLFGLMSHETLVLNDDEEMFISPLRPDPRPMDGIFHATFVSARMHYAMRAAKESDLLSPEQLGECERFLAASRKAFFDGYGLVAAKATMTTTGKTIMQAAHRYMQDSASVAA